MAAAAVEEKGFRPGVVPLVQTFGDGARFHPHVFRWLRPPWGPRSLHLREAEVHAAVVGVGPAARHDLAARVEVDPLAAVDV